MPSPSGSWWTIKPPTEKSDPRQGAELFSPPKVRCSQLHALTWVWIPRLFFFCNNKKKQHLPPLQPPAWTPRVALPNADHVHVCPKERAAPGLAGSSKFFICWSQRAWEMGTMTLGVTFEGFISCSSAESKYLANYSKDSSRLMIFYVFRTWTMYNIILGTIKNNPKPDF